jgi:hypothetical protein
MIRLIEPLLLCVALASQPPAAARSETSAKKKETTSQSQPASTANQKPSTPVPAPSAPSTRPPDSVGQPITNHQDTRSRQNDWGDIVLSALTLVLLGVQAWIMWRQSQIAEKQRSIMEGQKTLLVTQSAAASSAATAATDTLATNREIERAYISMRYRDLFFLERAFIDTRRPEDHHQHPDTVYLVCELRNVGRTPGTIVGGWCGFLYRRIAQGEPILLPAMDSSTTLSPVFLRHGENDPMDFALTITLSKIRILFLRNGEPEHGATIVEGEDIQSLDTMGLWLAGEIDYLDRFGQFHRCGYGTRWDRRAGRFVVDPSVARLNYDRPLTDQEIARREYGDG